MKKDELTALKINRDRCIFALVNSVLMVVFVFLAIVFRVLQKEDMVVREVGLQTFRMFTVLSNMLMAIGFAMVIPYAVDGLRYRNYHLPRWVVDLLFMGTTCVSLTFIIAVTALSAMAGFDRMMIQRTNIFFHTLVPLLSIYTFLFINTDHEIRFRANFLAMLPMILYSIAYLILAFGIGEKAGGWRDHYHFAEMMPLYLAIPLMYALTFGIAAILRLLHNAAHKRFKAAVERYYQEHEDYSRGTIEEAVAALARENKEHDKGGEVIVPRRIIQMMQRKNGGDKSLSELCSLYLSEYMD